MFKTIAEVTARMALSPRCRRSYGAVGDLNGALAALSALSRRSGQNEVAVRARKCSNKNISARPDCWHKAMFQQAYTIDRGLVWISAVQGVLSARRNSTIIDMLGKLLLTTAVVLAAIHGSSAQATPQTLIRLDPGGDTGNEGRIEVLHRGQWGTVCDDDFDMNDAIVACHQLGYVGATSTKYFGEGSGQIWLDNLECTGSETAIFSCVHAGWGTHNCQHYEDAGVVCTLPAIRLVSGSTGYEGRVEVFRNGEWGTVCDDRFELNDANVACRQLGFSGATAVKAGAAYGQGSGKIWLDEVACGGSETTLDACSHITTHDCAHTEDVGVVCTPPKTKLRLVGGTTAYEGRVEVFFNGRWGTVCDDGFDLNDAHVVCRQLGYGSATKAPDGAAYGQGTGVIWMDELVCAGSEATIGDCVHQGWGSHNCRHFEDASVVCTPPSQTAPPPQTTPKPKTTTKPPCKVQISFTFDMSSSIPQDQFDLAKKFLIDFIKCSSLQSLDIKVGVNVFNETARTYIKMGEIPISDPKLTEKINSLKKVGGLSAIKSALSYMRVTTPWRTDAIKGAVILTDGNAQCDANGKICGDHSAEAQKAIDENIILFAVASGNPDLTKNSVLVEIASKTRVVDIEQACQFALTFINNLCGGCRDAQDEQGRCRDAQDEQGGVEMPKMSRGCREVQDEQGV
ncbi:deleted in malignant brain tumors 1 protein-like [Branchiostoma lanceolatum]|uniref:deleted in malignant brain tumors 1 protein-like n=1 Tax=Branchiostoma lanceolatum TaxID=7740 RepID=UPI0034560B5D